MACATLKRSLDFDPVHTHGRPSKRQRCAPMCVSPSASPPTTSSECNAFPSSPFANISCKITPEIMAAGIREEIKRLQRRKTLYFNPNSAEAQGGDSTDSPGSPNSNFPFSLSQNRDKPLFTFRQVGMICERMLNERETQLREEYDRILNMKLSEQYDAFVKFSNDQLHRRFDVSTTPSYLS